MISIAVVIIVLAVLAYVLFSLAKMLLGGIKLGAKAIIAFIVFAIIVFFLTAGEIDMFSSDNGLYQNMIEDMSGYDYYSTYED